MFIIGRIAITSWPSSSCTTHGRLTSAYVPLGAVGLRRPIADFFADRPFRGGLTYNSHPLGCATALANIAVLEEDDLVGNARRMGAVLGARLDDLGDEGGRGD